MTALQTPISAYFALAFAILFLLVGGLVSYIYIGSSANTRSLKANGVATEATITEQFLISREKRLPTRIIARTYRISKIRLTSSSSISVTASGSRTGK